MAFLARGVLALALLTPLAASADSWPRAVVREVFSESREWFVRVVPGNSLGDTVGFAGSPKGPYAKAEFYRRAADRSYRLVTEIALVNPVAPVDILVTDRGYLVTLDNWHNRGYGQVLVSYAPDGKRITSYALKDLFSEEEIRAFPHSVSSIQWHPDHFYIRQGQQSTHLSLDDKGASLLLEPETGRWQLCETRAGVFQCRIDNTRRAWQPFSEPVLRK